MTIETENSYTQYLIGDCGENLSFMDEKVTCYLSPIKALKLVKAKLKNPTITVG